MTNKKSGKKSVFRMIIDIVSWTIFALLMLLAAFLIYYVIATNIYARKGERFKPIVSLYTIISGSMLPTIQVYDVVVNQRIDDPAKLQEGDIITFISQSKINYGETITHRIIKVTYEDGKYYYTTKGDYNLVPDESPVEYNNVIGKVILKIPQLGQAQFFLLKQGSKLFLILIPAFGVLIYDLLKMLNLFGTKKKVDESLKTKDYKLTKEEEENLKKKIKERLVNKDNIIENKEDVKELENSSAENISLEAPKEEISSKDNNDKVEEAKEIKNTPLEENENYKESKQTHNTNLTILEKETVYKDGSISKLKETKKESNSNIKYQNKNNNQNRSKQSTNQTKKTNAQKKNNNGTNNSKKKTTSKKVNNNSKNQKNKQDIDVDKVLEKIKEKKY